MDFTEPRPHQGWPSFLITQTTSRVLAEYMREQNITLEQQLGETMQTHVIPQNPNAAFYHYGRALGLRVTMQILLLFPTLPPSMPRRSSATVL